MNSFFSITTFSMYINNCFIHNSYPPQIPICSSIPYKNPPSNTVCGAGGRIAALYLCVGNCCKAILLYSATLWVNLLALLDDDAFIQRVNGQNSLRVGDLLAVDEDAALLDKLAGFTVGAAQTRSDHGGQQADTTALDKLGVQLRAGHILVVGGTLNRPRAVACAFSASS